MEAQAHRFAQALGVDSFPGPARVAAARAQFESWRWQIDGPAKPEAQKAFPSWRAAVACSGLVALLAFGVVWQSGSPDEQTLAASRTEAPPEVAAPATPELAAPQPVPETAAVVQQTAPKPKLQSKQPPARPRGTDLDLVEADVHYRLHRIGACAGEPILITRNGTASLLVTAVGPPERRSAEIQEALADLTQQRLVRFEATETNTGEVPLEALGDAAQTLRPAPMLLNSPLARRFGSAAEFVRRSNEIVQRVELIYTQAWALHRHSGLPVPDHSHRSPARWLAEAMYRDHAQQIETHLDRIQQELEPLMTRTESDCGTAAPNGFEAARDLAALAHRLFAPATAEELSTADADVQRLGAAMAALRCSLR
jgi:hypothetical protein